MLGYHSGIFFLSNFMMRQSIKYNWKIVFLVWPSVLDLYDDNSVNNDNINNSDDITY